MWRHWTHAAASFFFLPLQQVSTLVTTRVPSVCLPVPQGLAYLDYQKQAIHALYHGRGLLLCDEMGLGKTISAIGALNLLMSKDSKVLIVAPKSLLSTWKRELQRWLVNSTNVGIGVATAQGGIPSCNDAQILLMNYDIVKKYRKDIDALGTWDVLICDEAHYLKSAETVRTKALLGDTYTRDNRGAIAAKRKWFLTGSPVLNNPIELYPLLKSLDPTGKVIPELRKVDKFCERYCGRKETPWGVVYKGGRNLSELRQRLRSGEPPLMLRRVKKDVLQDLPTKRHELIPLEDEHVAVQEERTLQQILAKTGATTLSNDEKLSLLTVTELKSRLQARGLSTTGKKAELVERLRQYNVANSRARVYESRNDKSPTFAISGNIASVLRSETGGRRWEGLQHILKGSGEDRFMIMGALSKARHATALAKIPHAIECIEKLLDSQKVVVFAHHRDVQDALLEAFYDRAVALHGGSTQEERAHVVQEFQENDSIRLFIGSIRAAGVGITLTAASHVLFVELDWSPMIVQQAEDRTHRVGQKKDVLVQYLFFRGTIDEYLASLLASKQSTVAAAVDAPKGAARWVFDFGKHKGETVADVAASHEGYLEWIVDERAHIGRDGLAKALQELGYITASDATPPTERADSSMENDNREADPTKDVKEIRLSPPVIDEDFIMPFGKHKGKRLADMPKSYLRWLVSSGASQSNFDLNTALGASQSNFDLITALRGLNDMDAFEIDE